MYLDLPEVLGLHGDVVVDVAGHLLAVRGHRGSHVVRVQGPRLIKKLLKLRHHSIYVNTNIGPSPQDHVIAATK